MLATVLKSEKAVNVSIDIMDAFVEMLAVTVKTGYQSVSQNHHPSDYARACR